MILVVNCVPVGRPRPGVRAIDGLEPGRLRGRSPGGALDRTAGSCADPSVYSHLILSGSEASVTEEQAWEQALGDLVRQFVAARKPVLGICYGHQFLAKTLAGPGHVRRAARSEVGFLDLALAPNPLFHGLEQPLVMVTHNDEAFDLPEAFEVLASSPDCSVHAFQVPGPARVGNPVPPGVRCPAWGTDLEENCSAAPRSRFPHRRGSRSDWSRTGNCSAISWPPGTRKRIRRSAKPAWGCEPDGSGGGNPRVLAPVRGERACAGFRPGPLRLLVRFLVPAHGAAAPARPGGAAPDLRAGVPRSWPSPTSTGSRSPPGAPPAAARAVRCPCGGASPWRWTA